MVAVEFGASVTQKRLCRVHVKLNIKKRDWGLPFVSIYESAVGFHGWGCGLLRLSFRALSSRFEELARL